MAKEISPHLVSVYAVVKRDSGWLTARDVASLAGIAGRTARAHAAELASSGVFDVAKVFGGFRYRIRTELEPAASAFVGDIEAASRILRGNA